MSLKELPSMPAEERARLLAEINSLAPSVKFGVRKNTPLRYPYGLSEIRGYYLCRADKAKMTTLGGGWGLIRVLKELSGLTIVHADPVFLGGEDQGHGYTLNATLSESGIAWDCWPEYGTVLQYADLCNVTQDHRVKFDIVWKIVAHYFRATFQFAMPITPVPIRPDEFIVA